MAYSQTQFQLTHLLQEVWHKLGQMRRWDVTGGSQTTVINTDWALTEEPVFEDDDPALIMGTAVVIRDAGGLGAAPEGEWGMITDYDSGSSTVTIDTVSANIAAGDKVGIVTPLFPVEDMISLANIAMQKLGEIDVVDTSIVGVAAQSEYTLPSAIRKYPIRVRRQTFKDTDDNQWQLVPNTNIIPAVAGSNWTIYIPDLDVGYKVEILYRAKHPTLTAFDSPIQESVNPELAVAALMTEALQWYNNLVGGSNQYFLQRENKAIQDLEAALVRFPTRRIVEQVSGMPHWNRRSEYVPGTSDRIV